MRFVTGLTLFAAAALWGSITAAQDQGAQPATAPSEGGTVRDEVHEVDWTAIERAKESRAEKAARGTEAPVTAAIEEARADREALRQVRLPVLLPNPPDLPRLSLDMTVFPRENSYAASLKLEGLLIEVFGTRVSKELPEGASPPEQSTKMRGAAAGGYLLQRTEYGMELSFERWGCSYNISITCDDPQGDERCRADGFITSLADSMVIVGGEPGPDK